MHHEIVKVLDDRVLSDRECNKCPYATADGHPLAPGYYIVCWPPGIEGPRYDENATYYGPFIQQRQAELLLLHCIEDYARKHLRKSECAPSNLGAK